MFSTQKSQCAYHRDQNRNPRSSEIEAEMQVLANSEVYPESIFSRVQLRLILEDTPRRMPTGPVGYSNDPREGVCLVQQTPSSPRKGVKHLPIMLVYVLLATCFSAVVGMDGANTILAEDRAFRKVLRRARRLNDKNEAEAPATEAGEAPAEGIDLSEAADIEVDWSILGDHWQDQTEFVDFQTAVIDSINKDFIELDGVNSMLRLMAKNQEGDLTDMESFFEDGTIDADELATINVELTPPQLDDMTQHVSDIASDAQETVSSDSSIWTWLGPFGGVAIILTVIFIALRCCMDNRH